MRSIVIQATGAVALVAAIANPAWGAGPVNSCKLLTAQEVGAALHEQVQPSQAMPFGACIWRGTGTDSVTVELPGTGLAGFNNAKGRTSPIVPLPGVGDAAFAFVSVAGFVQASLVKSGTFLTVLVQTNRDAQAAAKSLSAKIASRL